MDTTLSANAAYNEVKKMQRFLDALKQLEPVLQVVADEEKLRDELKNQIDGFKKEQQTEEAKVKVASETVVQIQQKIKNLNDQYTNRVQEINTAEARLVSETGRKLETLKMQGLAQTEQNRMELAGLQTAIATLKKTKYGLEKDIADLKFQAKNQAKSMFDAFQHVGK